MDIKSFIYNRARLFVAKESLWRITQENELMENDLERVPIQLLETLETIKNYKRASNVLLDIGTHKGLFSKAADAFFRFDKIVCFEPNLNQIEAIRENIKNSNMVIENIALSDNKGETSFFLHEDDSMNSTVEVDEGVLKEEFPWDNPDLCKETMVKTDTLDSYVLKNNLSNEVFFIKIDTQGNELNILKHGIETLKKTEVCLIEFMFLTPYKSEFNFYDLLDFMNKNHFDCKGALTISKRPSKKISGVDFLFVKR